MISSQSEPDTAVWPVGDLLFQASSATTVGIELELQILDPDKELAELVPGAAHILDACRQENLPGVDEEFLQCMIEVKTDICQNINEARHSLFQLVRRVRNIARAVGYDLALGGTHPFSRACKNAISSGERYQRIRQRQGWLAYHEAIFGLHVHVGVPSAEHVQGLMNLLVPYLPHLLALSSNSPFWQGVDTEFCSARSALFRPSPHAGIPCYFSTWEDFCHYFTAMCQSGIYETDKDLYWALRPRPELGTIEFRICDAPASLDMVLALAALIRCLVINGLHQLEDDPALGRQGPEKTWLAMENKFLAVRYGMNATCKLEPQGRRLPLKEHTADLLHDVLPVARDFGERQFLEPFLVLDSFETSAEHLRRVYRQTGDWQSVIQQMKGGLQIDPTQQLSEC